MKSIKNILVAGLCIIGFASCDNLLDIEPVNSMIPKSVEDYESVLLGGYPNREYFMKTEMMTDNVFINSNARAKVDKKLLPWFIWAETHQSDNEEYDPYWNQLYSSIFYANTILEDLKGRNVTKEENELYEIVVGETYALRALSYFYLASLYAEPYSQENLTKPCVPLILTTEGLDGRTKNNTRESVQVIWEQITSDLEKASANLSGKKSKGKFRFNYYSVETLRSRVFLFMEDWDAAISSSSKVISASKPYDMNQLQSLIDEAYSPSYFLRGDHGLHDTAYEEDILFSLGGKAGYNIYYYPSGALKPSLDLFDTYIEKNATGDTIGDYRRYIFESFEDINTSYGREIGKTVYEMYASQGTPCYYVGLKVGEVYITRAEAYARKKLKTKALDDLKMLMKNRIKSDDYTDYVTLIEGEENYLSRILKERRKETAFDAGLRWFDLRRLGKPALIHIDADGNVHELKKDDLRYVLQIPISEQKASPDMVLNPR